jgi:Tc5 transposase DNA-binding domain
MLKPQPVNKRFRPNRYVIGAHNHLSLGKKRDRTHAKTAGVGRVVEYLELERKLHKWIEELRLEDILVRTNKIIAQAINLDETGQFKRGNAVSITRWVYHFLERWDLSNCRVTRVGQKLSGHLQKIKDDTTTSINKRFLPGHPMHGLDPHYFLNMDQTAAYFESKSKTVVAKKGAKQYRHEIVVVTEKDAQWWSLLQQMVPSCHLFSYSKGSLANSWNNN